MPQAPDASFSPLLNPAPLDILSGVGTFVTTRHGGSSRGAYSSLNCSPYCGDEAVHVTANTNRLRVLLGEYPHPFIIPRQVHGTVVRPIDIGFLASDSSVQEELLDGVDALITDLPSCALCVTTADCLPVFFFDTRQRAVGIAHSGWRGTVNHIALATLRALQNEYGTSPEDVRVAFGPCISQSAFEVGEEVYEAFSREGFPMPQIAARHPQRGKWHISLQAAVGSELVAAGIREAHIEFSPYCTYANPETFFSARRLGIRSGRILSGIFLCPAE